MAEVRGFLFTHQDRLFVRAVELGCVPVWVGYYWQCRCTRRQHGHSERGSITPASLAFSKSQEVKQ